MLSLAKFGENGFSPTYNPYNIEKLDSIHGYLLRDTFQKNDINSEFFFETSLSAAKEFSMIMRGKDNLNLENNDLTHAEYNYENIINYTKKWGDFTELLSQISFFKKEFLKILSMKRMFEYIINDKSLFEEHWKFIVDVSKLFFEHFDFKLKIKDKNSFEEEYSDEYKKFSRDFMKKEKFFYTKIYSRSKYYDEKVLGDITKLLVR